MNSAVGEDAKGAKIAKFAKERILVLLKRIISGR
jgi:hypothetical protein